MIGDGEDLMLINMSLYNDISINFSTYTKQIRNLYAAIEYVLIFNSAKSISQFDFRLHG